MRIEAPSSPLREAVLRSRQRCLVAARLEGSHAERRAPRESDIDLGMLFGPAVLVDRRARFEAGLALHAELAPAARGAAPDLVVLNDAPPGLAVAVVMRGVAVLVQDPEREHAFRRAVPLRAADLLPFLRRTQAIKREAIARCVRP
jgi:predicted nucleotidyltransferase